MMDDASETFFSLISQELATGTGKTTLTSNNFFSDSAQPSNSLQAESDPGGITNSESDTGNWWMFFTTMSTLLEDENDLGGPFEFEQLTSENPFSFYSNYSFNSSYLPNSTNFSSPSSEEMPRAMREMSESAKTSVLIYSIIWIIASTGNLTVFASCYRQYKKHKSRITLLILHLSVADLIVSFCLIPIEIAWRITIQWYGGNLLCKLCQFIRAFGLYLSSMVLICVSFDRFFSILFPLKFAGGKRRVKVMLGLAWAASGIFSLPQAIFFSVETHPKFAFRQCVTSSFLSSPEDVRMYSIFSVSAMYFAPLLVIIFTYTAILLKIIRKSRQQQSNTAFHSTTTTLSTPTPSSTRFSIKSQLRRANSASASSSHTTALKKPTTPLPPAMNLNIHNSEQMNDGDNSAETFTPSPSTKASIRRFNFSRGSIERTNNRGGSVRWGRGTLLQVPGGDASSGISSSAGGSAASSVTASPAYSGAKSHFQFQERNNTMSEDEFEDSSTTISMNPMSMGSINLRNGSSRPNPDPLTRTMSMRNNPNKPQLILRMSNNATTNITRAKSRTLRLTLVIIIFFVLCWSPYVVMTLWYMFDWETAQKVPKGVQDALFMMAVANSCVNPLIYGSFTKNCCGLTKRLNRNRSRKDGRPSTIKEALESHASNN